MRFGRTGSRLLAVCLLLLAFILAFSGCTVFAVRPAVSGETTGAETTGTTEPAEGSLVALLLENEEIPAFNQAVVKKIHEYYTHYYVGDLGTDAELAAAIADFYLEYRNLIDETDQSEVTDLLCESYLAAAGDKYAYYL